MTITYRLVKGTPLTNAEVDENFSTLVENTSNLESNVGVLANLTTANSNLVSAINEVKANVTSNFSTLNGNIGVLSNLTTTAKSNLVSAINEARVLATGYTDSNARRAISVTGSGSYDNATGVITVTGGVVSVGGATGAVSNAQLLASINEATGGGGGGGLDAATLDGFDSSYFINTSANTQTKTGNLILTGNVQAIGGFVDNAGTRLLIKDQNGSTIWG